MHLPTNPASFLKLSLIIITVSKFPKGSVGFQCFACVSSVSSNNGLCNDGQSPSPVQCSTVHPEIAGCSTVTRKSGSGSYLDVRGCMPNITLECIKTLFDQHDLEDDGCFTSTVNSFQYDDSLQTCQILSEPKVEVPKSELANDVTESVTEKEGGEDLSSDEVITFKICMCSQSLCNNKAGDSMISGPKKLPVISTGLLVCVLYLAMYK